MNVTEKDYRIWKNKNFVIESTITVKLWDEILINDFHEKLNKIYFKDTVNSFPTRKCEVETQTNQVLGLEVKNREADKVYILGQGQRLTKNLSQMLDTGLDWVVENRFRY